MGGGQDRKRCVVCKELHHSAEGCNNHISDGVMGTTGPIKNQDSSRELAESHWTYTGQVLELSKAIPASLMPLVEYLYVEAMLHGYKHAKEDL